MVIDPFVLKRKESPDNNWIRPPHGWVKLNSDGSVKLEDNTVGTGMILRDEEGQVVFSACQKSDRLFRSFGSRNYGMS
jgi:hypothetical protein